MGYPRNYTQLKQKANTADKELCKFLKTEIKHYAAMCGGETVLSRTLHKSEKYVTMGLYRGNTRSLESIWLKCIKKLGPIKW